MLTETFPICCRPTTDDVRNAGRLFGPDGDAMAVWGEEGGKTRKRCALDRGRWANKEVNLLAGWSFARSIQDVKIKEELDGLKKNIANGTRRILPASFDQWRSLSLLENCYYIISIILINFLSIISAIQHLGEYCASCASCIWMKLDGNKMNRDRFKTKHSLGCHPWKQKVHSQLRCKTRKEKTKIHNFDPSDRIGNHVGSGPWLCHKHDHDKFQHLRSVPWMRHIALYHIVSWGCFS